MDTRSLIFNQKVIINGKIIKIKDIFYLDAQIISTQKTKPLHIHILLNFYIFNAKSFNLIKLFKSFYDKIIVKTITKNNY